MFAIVSRKRIQRVRFHLRFRRRDLRIRMRAKQYFAQTFRRQKIRRRPRNFQFFQLLSFLSLELLHRERGIARDGYKVLDDGGREIGYVTSGSPAPFLKKNIALAYVPPQLAALGTTVKVEIRGQGVGAQVVSTPFYKRPKKTA